MPQDVHHVDIVVAGAGVVGLAIARALALQGHEVMVLEAETTIGAVTSSRNSGVIHAGLYYRPGSLKAQCCLEGRRLMLDFAARHGVTADQCGKLVVAASDKQLGKLEELKANAVRNGVEGLRLLDATEARRMEPELACAAALYCPESGVIDVHGYMQALQGEAEAHGATIVCRAPILGGHVEANGFRLRVGDAAAMELSCRILINAAGLGAQDLAASLDGVSSATIPPLVYAKGSYFSLSGPPPFSMLIYPLPVEGSLGLHYCRDHGGRGRFGPDIEWVTAINYDVDPIRLAGFAEIIRSYWPKLDVTRLHPDYAGIRPKLGRLSHHDSDFVIQTMENHGVAGLINLYGIESPGLTSSLALAGKIAKLLPSS